jgi:Leucine-rich repeat (LRR) protein
MVYYFLSILLKLMSLLVYVHSQYYSSNCNLFEGCECVLKANARYDIMCIGTDRESGKFPARNPNPPDNLAPAIGFYEVTNYSFGQIPAKSFQNLNIESLFLANNQLANITKETFAGISSLRYLNIYEKSLTIESDSLGNINGLEELSLSAQITDEKLDMIRSDLVKLKPTLRSLGLANNNLTSFDTTYTDILNELQTLVLSANSIRSFSANAFRTMTKLQMLALSLNPLNDSNHLFENVLRPLNNSLTQLFLRGVEIEVILSFYFKFYFK